MHYEQKQLNAKNACRHDFVAEQEDVWYTTYLLIMISSTKQLDDHDDDYNEYYY